MAPVAGSKSVPDRWRREAKSQGEAKIGLPLASLLGEALDLAAHFDAHWGAAAEAPDGPCFSQLDGRRIYRQLGEEIRELAQVIASVQAARSLTRRPPIASALSAGQRLLSELRSTLAFVFDDPQDERARAQLERLAKEFTGTLSQDALALALESYADLLTEHRAEVERETNFDFAECEQARCVAAALRQNSSNLLTAAASQQTTALRNQLLTLLVARMRSVRRAARYLFREDPERIKLFESVHERARRRVRKGK
jgi:hypothetical protein